MTHLCKNNSTKRYSGFEPTPLGLGYSATGYPIGTIKKGRDDNLWRVESNEFSLTKNKYSICWRKYDPKFNLTNLTDDYYTHSYIPITESINYDKDILEKIGGYSPFFLKGEKWPMHNNIPMMFICQLKDPRVDDNILYRVFLPLENEYDFANFYHITKIELNEENLKNKISISKPMIKEEFTFNNLMYHQIDMLKPNKIIGWQTNKEMVDFEKIKNKFNITNESSHDLYMYLYTKYEQSIYYPYNGIKVGGTPYSAQGHDYIELKHDFLQIVNDNLIKNFKFSEEYNMHISTECTVMADCG